MKIIGTVRNVKILENSKDLMIEFETENNINSETIIQIEYNNQPKYFNVRGVEISNDKLIGKAYEYGYYESFITYDEELDIRNLINKNIHLITDEKLIDEIKLYNEVY